jgi:nitrous oxidase accessory protein NosD
MQRAILGFVLGITALAAAFAMAPGDEPQPGESVAARVGKKRGSFVTVLDFGALGDGVTDDAAAIQELINAKAGSIRFPAGTYRIKKPLLVELDKVGFTSFVADGSARLVMAGPGPAIRFVGTHAGTAAPESFKPEVWERQRMPVVEGLAIAGEHADADGIEATGTMQLTLRGVHIRKCRHGVHLVQRNRNVLIEACHIYENSGCGVYFDHVDLHQTNISASHISYCGGGGVVVRGGNVRNIHIAGCDIEANMAQDAPPTANVLLDCADGSVAEVAITGCTIQHTKDAPDSANIRILGRGFMDRRGQRMAFNCGNVTIGDNVLSDVQTNIHLAGVRGVTITGNTLWQGYAHNLLVEDSLHVVLGPNMMERNPLYAYTTEGRDGVVFRRCQDCTIQGLHLHNVSESEAGLLLEKCERMQVTGCTILDCDNVGILAKDCTRSRVHNNLVRDDRLEAKSIPIKVLGGSGNDVSEK